MGNAFQLYGASVIIYTDNKVLLQQRKDNQCWGYHGGRVELGEKVEDAAKRELLEETGLTAINLNFSAFFQAQSCIIFILMVTKYILLIPFIYVITLQAPQ